jgi:molecular chaperone GrpE
MTSARRPAGAPDEPKGIAGVPDEGTEKERAAEAAGAGEKAADGATDSPIEADIDSAAAVDADLDALLADVRRERDEYLEIAQRARADFENYRKRAARETQDAERRGKAGLARELIPALDNLERALRAAGLDPDAMGSTDSGEAPSEEVSAHEALARGVALVYHDMRGVLERAGVETYDPTGERFDPTQHEALAVRDAEDGVDAGVVIETLDKGYRLDGQVLRAARVVVSG